MHGMSVHDGSRGGGPTDTAAPVLPPANIDIHQRNSYAHKCALAAVRIDAIHAFITVAESRNFTEAAHLLFISQPGCTA